MALFAPPVIKRFTAGLVFGVAFHAGHGMAAPETGAINAAKIYQEFCSVCHGDKGDGKSRAQHALAPAPRDFSTPAAAAELTRDRMIYSVTNGRRGTAMPPWKFRLKPQEIEAVVDHIRTNFMMKTGANAPGAAAPAKPAPAPAAPGPQNSVKPAAPAAQSGKAEGTANMAAAFPKGLVGDVEKGKELYMHSCISCHGRDGNGQGPRAYFIFPKPRDFTQIAAHASYNRPFLYNAIAKGKVGTVMPAWDKVLKEQEIANVAEFVFQQFIRPESSKPRSN